MDRIELIEKAAFDKDEFFNLVLRCRQRYFVGFDVAFDKAVDEIKVKYPDWKQPYKNAQSMRSARSRKKG